MSIPVEEEKKEEKEAKIQKSSSWMSGNYWSKSPSTTPKAIVKKEEPKPPKIEKSDKKDKKFKNKTGDGVYKIGDMVRATIDVETCDELMEAYSTIKNDEKF